jgi:nitrate reductase (NAD(P)H)
MWWRESSFCWSFWSLEIPVADLASSDAILVRAVDDALSAQPRDMYWSVLGMMNNPWFRIAITKEGNILKFEHPTHPAKSGGWMERVKKTGGDLLNGSWGERAKGEEPVEPEPVKEINMKMDGVSRQIDLQELKANCTSEKPWFVVNGEVYDGTGFLEGHPGGAISITSSAGLDVSEDFLAIRELQFQPFAMITLLISSQTVKLPRK